VSADQQALRDTALVERLGHGAFALQDNGNGQWGIGNPVDRGADLADLLQLILVRDNDELPRLGVARASCPAGNLQQFFQDVLWHRFVIVEAGLADVT
jgi:hypothetical protein